MFNQVLESSEDIFISRSQVSGNVHIRKEYCNLPGVSMIPIKVAGGGKVCIQRGWICNITHECIHPGFILALSEPAWVKVGNHGSCVDEISIACNH